MSAYPPPNRITSIFNPLNFNYTAADGGVTQAVADTLYVSLIKSQGVNGSKSFNAPLTANSIVNITDTTQSTNATTGCLTLAGGLGVQKAVHINGTCHLNAAGSELQLTGANSNIVMSGTNGFQSIANTSASTSSTTGALRVAGGAYFGANSLLGSDLGFVKSGFTNTLTSQALTSNRVITIPNNSGTVALTSDISLPILRTGNNFLAPAQTNNGTAISGSFTLSGKRLLVRWDFSGYTSAVGGIQYVMELNIATSVSATPLTVSTGTKSIPFYINQTSTHFTIPPIVYTVASGYASGTYNAYVKLQSNANFFSDANDPFTLSIQELP